MRYFVLQIISFVCAMHTIAQTNYYEMDRTFFENGYIYQCDVQDMGIITLYNKENKYIGTPLVYKATGEKPPFDLSEKRVENDNWSYDKSIEIINNAFSTEQKSFVRGKTFMVSIYIDSTTGRISDVKFTFPKRYPYAQIPLSVYRKIEVDLKGNVYFTPTEAGKKLNYIYFGWMLEVIIISIYEVMDDDTEYIKTDKH